MNRRSFAVLLAALALVAAGLLALLRWPPAPGREGETRPVPEVDSPAEQADSGLGEPAGVVVPVEQQAPVPSARTAVPGLAESFSLEEARWIEVTVRGPAGTPADEELELFGLAPAGEQAVEAYAHAVRRLLPSTERWEEILREDEGLRWSRRPVRSGETVRLPFPGDAPRGIVCLRARYLVEPPRTLQLEEAATIVMEPALGAWLTGELQLSQAARELGLERAQVKVWEREQFFSFAPLAETHTDDTQRFELRGLSAGPWSLTVSGDGFLPHDQDLTLGPGERRHVVVVPADGRSVYGRVHGPDGEARVDARVGHGPARRMEELQRSSRTDGEGRYRLHALPDGEIRLRAVAEGWLDLEEVVTIDGEDVEHDLHLERAASLAGRVLRPDGAAVEGAAVESFHGERSTSLARSDAEGRFVVTGLDPERSYDLIAYGSESSSTHWRLTGWVKRQGLAPGGPELMLTLLPPIGFAGRVVDDAGRPYAAFRVQATRRPGQRSWEGGVQVWERFEDDGGAFRLEGLHPGEWSVTAAADDGANDVQPTIVTLPTTAEVTLVLPRGMRIEGVVVDPSGEPVTGAEAHVIAPNLWGRSQDDGTFVIEGVPPGSVELSARHEAWAPPERTSIDLVAGVLPEPVRLVMRTGGRILGEVYDAEGRPDPFKRVMIDGSGPGWYGSTTKTDEDGRFVLARVVPGKLTVVVLPGDAFGGMLDSDQDDTEMLNALGQMRTAQVEVVDGEDTHVVLGGQPHRPVWVDGRVTSSGEPLEGAMVVALSEGESMFEGMRAGRTGAGGHYELELAGSGFYVFAVSDEYDDPIPIRTVFVPSAPSFTLDLEVPVGGIRGTVTEADGGPAVGVRVLPLANPPLPGLSELGTVREVSTEADGTYALEGLLPGVYDLHVEGTVLEGVELRPGEVLVDVDLRLEARRSLAGLVLDEAGQGVPGARVFVHDARGRLLAGVDFDRSGNGGRFRIEGVPSTAVQVSARFAGGACPPLSVEAGEPDVGDLELFLAPGGTLRVTLLREGQPTLGSLLVRDEEERVVSGLGLVPDDINSSTPLRLSELVVGPLPPGRYTLEATGPEGTRARRRITLRAGSERTVQLRLR